MLMSDVTYLLDESLSKLSEIHQIQTEMDDTTTWEAQPQVRGSSLSLSLSLFMFCRGY